MIRRFPSFTPHERYWDAAYARRSPKRWRRKWCGPKPSGAWALRRFELHQHATVIWARATGRLSWRGVA